MTAATDVRSPSLLRELASRDPLDLLPRLTLLLVIPIGAGLATVAWVGVVSLVAADRRLYRSGPVWLAIAGVRGIDQLVNWHGLDDHLVLITYWCLAMGLCLLTERPSSSLALSGRLLVGLTFAFATWWKLTSGEFVDGTFFHHTLLADPRFEPITRWLGGLSDADHTANLDAIATMRHPLGDVTSITLVDTGRIGLIALVLTWGTILVESTAALCWLAPARFQRLHATRHAVLLLFVALTYTIVPVMHFGLVLLVMGAAACTDHEGRWYRVAYPLAIGFCIVWSPIHAAIAGLA